MYTKIETRLLYFIFTLKVGMLVLSIIKREKQKTDSLLKRPNFITFNVDIDNIGETFTKRIFEHKDQKCIFLLESLYLLSI